MFETIQEILNYKIGIGEIGIKVSTLVLLLIVLIITSIVLRFIRVVATRKLPLEDKYKFISFFQFIRYIVFAFAIIITLQMNGVNMSFLLTA